MYTVNEIKNMVENIVNILNSSGTLNNQDTDDSSNILNSENVPIINEKNLENVELEIENKVIRSQVVSVVLKTQK